MNVKHSAKSCEHGTPHEVVELARYALGSIDLDPASSEYWNWYAVKAARFYDRAADGLTQPWSGNVLVNPPGADDVAKSPSLVRPFWERLVWYWQTGQLTGAVYHGYSLEQLQMLQSSPWSPNQCVTLVYAKRVKHLKQPVDGGPPVPGGSPTHANFTTLLAGKDLVVARDQIARFAEQGGKLGQLVRPL